MEYQQDLEMDVALAIVGLAGRFPGAETVTQFWENLANGVKSTHFFSDEELKALGVEPELYKNPTPRFHLAALPRKINRGEFFHRSVRHLI